VEEVAGPPEPAAARFVEAIVWRCRNCRKECVPLRDESRCLCGHRLKHHWKPGEAGGRAWACKQPGCKCPCFFFLVAEGSWMLRCRCKHKGVDHDPVTRRCTKPNCKACPEGGFDSPWVCNCDCPWSEHEQLVVQKRVLSVREMLQEEARAPEYQNWAHIQRGRDAG